jgi:hypothetical protein
MADHVSNTNPLHGEPFSSDSTSESSAATTARAGPNRTSATTASLRTQASDEPGAGDSQFSIYRHYSLGSIVENGASSEVEGVADQFEIW